MTSKATKAKRRAIPSVTLEELVQQGLIHPYHHLRDHVDMKEEQLARGIARRLAREAAEREAKKSFEGERSEH